MADPKISITGKLRFSETGGLQFPALIGKGESKRLFWLEAVPNADEWPGIPKIDDKSIDMKVLHADKSYQIAAKEFLELQRREPQHLLVQFWAYKDHAVAVNTDEPQTLNDPARNVLMIKHYMLRRERDFERLKREVEALENLEKLERVSRAPIAESVRLFVWQRDGGQCVICGTRELLEFDHIIPLSKGGSSTERNLQLLCEPCNRTKGATI